MSRDGGMFGAGWDAAHVKLSAAVTGAVALATTAWWLYDVYRLSPDAGADIGFGLFFMGVTTPAAFWAVLTALQSWRVADIGPGWRLGSLAVALVLVPLVLVVPCWTCLIA